MYGQDIAIQRQCRRQGVQRRPFGLRQRLMGETSGRRQPINRAIDDPAIVIAAHGRQGQRRQ